MIQEMISKLEETGAQYPVDFNGKPIPPKVF